jgi:ligand-binding sensor domain-containing protein
MLSRLLTATLALVTLATAAAAPAHAERLTLKNYTTADGLAHDWVTRIARDSRGFLWFCTEDGLSRFDGYGFVNYGVDQGLPAAIVNDLLEARDGRYWIATSAGLVLFDPRGTTAARFTTYPVRRDGRHAYVNALLEDHDGVLWIATREGLYRAAPNAGPNASPDAGADAGSSAASRGGFTPVDLGPLEGALPQADVQQIIEDRHGALWIGTRAGLYRRLATGQVDEVPIAAPPRPMIHSLLEDRSGAIWIGTRSEGLFQVTVDPVSQRASVTDRYALGRGLPSNWINGIAQTSDDTLWVGCDRGLLQLVPTRGQPAYRVRAYATPHGIVDRQVISLVEDRDRTLWVGTAYAGVAKVSHRGLTTFDSVDGVDWGRSIVETRGGELVALAGDERLHGFLTRFDGQQFVNLGWPVRQAEPSWGWSQTLLQNRTGDWWIGTSAGLFRFSHVRRLDDLARAAPSAIYTARDGLRGETILRLFEDSRGDIWIGTTGGAGGFGLSRWQRDTGTFRHYAASDSLPLAQFFVSAFAEDRTGRVWIGFSGLGGLARQEGDGFTRYTARDGLPAGSVMNLMLDAKGRLWDASDRAGVGRIDALTAARPAFVTYATAQGLSSNAANAVAEDRGRSVDIDVAVSIC